MKKCKTKDKTCPFQYKVVKPCKKLNGLDAHYIECALGYSIVNMRGGLSKDCKLEVVQYATDEKDSITFIPDEE